MKRDGARRAKEKLELSLFGDAVRAVLGLEPIFHTGRGSGLDPEVERFHVEPIRCGLFGDSLNGQTPRRAGA